MTKHCAAWMLLVMGCAAADGTRQAPVDASTAREAPAAISEVTGDIPPEPAPSARPISAHKRELLQETPTSMLAQQSSPRISLDLKDADVRNVLRLIAEVAKVNITATDEVQGRLTLKLFEVPWEQALAIILRSAGLDSQHEGSFLRVSTLKRWREEREEQQKAQLAEAALEPLETAYFHLDYSKAERIAEILGGQAPPTGESDLATTLSKRGVLSARGSAFVDEVSNTLVVRDVATGVAAARDLVRELDVRTRQVLIESHIVETTSDLGRDLGIQWGYSYQRTLANGHPTGSTFPHEIQVAGSKQANPASTVPLISDFPAAHVVPGMGSTVGMVLTGVDGIHNLEMRLTALEREGRAKIISRPRVVTLDNVPATIKSLTVIRVKLPTSGPVVQTGSGSSVPSTAATEKIETGIVLVVTPQVSADGFVTLDLFAKSSQADFTRTVDDIPTEISREASSHVLVRDGETVVLGGIYRESTVNQSSGVPYLRDIPGLGWLFRNQGYENRREDLLVFLTPHILDPARLATRSQGELSAMHMRREPAGPLGFEADALATENEARQ